MSELIEEYGGCYPPNTYSTLVTIVFGGISLFGLLIVVVAGSFVAYQRTNAKRLEKQMKLVIQSKQQKQNDQSKVTDENTTKDGHKQQKDTISIENTRKKHAEKKQNNAECKESSLHTNKIDTKHVKDVDITSTSRDDTTYTSGWQMQMYKMVF